MAGLSLEMRQIIYGTADYYSALVLRNAALRKPLGMDISDDNLEADKVDIHIGAFLGPTFIGTLILTILNGDEVKMRQVAVDENERGNGIGAKLVIFAENVVNEAGRKKMVLNARKVVVEFYKKLGYTIDGEEFVEVGIPHFKMEKRLR